MTNIYILRLQGGKFYIGKSEDPMKRFQEHLSGNGSSWTRKYKPLKVERIIENASPFDEDKFTKEMMAKHGIENVRGGSYVSEILDEIQEEALLRELWGAKDCCTQCGRKSHFIKDCFANTDVNGNELESSSEEEFIYYPKQCYQKRVSSKVIQKKVEPTVFIQKKSIQKKDSCYRCGREGHYAYDCFATRHVKGYYLDSDDD